MEAASVAHGHHEHHRRPRPTAPRASIPSMLGMLLFIISEVMVFGAFFTAYFFIRVVQGAEWPAEGDHLPKVIAGVNTAILISSSFTLHWAEHSNKQGNRRGCRRASSRPPAGHGRSCSSRSTSTSTSASRPGQRPGHDLLRPARAARRARLHRPHAAAVVTIRAFRGHFVDRHRGIDVPGIYWHFVDVMWIVVYVTVTSCRRWRTRLGPRQARPRPALRDRGRRRRRDRGAHPAGALTFPYAPH